MSRPLNKLLNLACAQRARAGAGGEDQLGVSGISPPQSVLSVLGGLQTLCPPTWACQLHLHPSLPPSSACASSRHLAPPRGGRREDPQDVHRCGLGVRRAGTCSSARSPCAARSHAPACRSHWLQVGPHLPPHLGCQPNLSSFPNPGSQTGSWALLLSGPRDQPIRRPVLSRHPTAC